MTDFVTARNDMFALFKAAWDASAAAIVTGADFPLATEIANGSVAWWMVEPANLPPPNKYWVRVSVQNVTEGLVSIGASQINAGQKFMSAGLIFVQCFGPMLDAQVGDKLLKLALIARNAYRGKVSSANVWFRNARIQPLGPDGTFQRMNAVAEFQFYETA